MSRAIPAGSFIPGPPGLRARAIAFETLSMRPRILLLAALSLIGLSCAPRDESADPDARPIADPTVAPVRHTAPPKAPSALLPRIDAALDNVRSRDLRTTNAFWTIFHGILGLGPGVALLDDQTGQRVNALDYICSGGNIRGLELMPTNDGLDVVTQAGTGVGQGHQDQFVAEMVQWGASPDRPVFAAGKPYTFADFFRHSKARASTTKGQELSWAIIIIAEHFGTDCQWTNAFGEKMTFDGVVRYELEQPIDTAACGGTHRLFGLSWAYHRHRQKGGKTTGVWQDLVAKTELYKKQARQFQHPDGSFSTAYVSKAENNPDLKARIASTGHVFEWLALALTDDELRQPWVEDAASALSVMILQNASNPIDSGAMYHAVHGLYIYRARAFGVAGPAGLTIPPAPKS